MRKKKESSKWTLHSHPRPPRTTSAAASTVRRRQALRNNSPTPPWRGNILSPGQAFLIDFICAHVRLCPNEGRCRCGTVVASSAEAGVVSAEVNVCRGGGRKEEEKTLIQDEYNEGKELCKEIKKEKKTRERKKF